MQQIAKIDCDGFAIGGLAVGEPTEVMYRIIEAVEPYMPAHKPRYLMGVGTPSNIIEGWPGRGLLRLRYARPQRPPRQALYLAGGYEHQKRQVQAGRPAIDPECDCPVCRRFSRAYVRHLFAAEEILALRLAVMHNLYFYNKLASASATAWTPAALRTSAGSTARSSAAVSDGFSLSKKSFDKLCAVFQNFRKF